MVLFPAKNEDDCLGLFHKAKSMAKYEKKETLSKLRSVLNWNKFCIVDLFRLAYRSLCLAAPKIFIYYKL